MNNKINYDYINIDDIVSGLKNEEFKVYYQLQVNSKGEIIGVEALARWFNEKYGTIYPDIFIPILENNNKIYEFQNYIFDKACKQIGYLNDIIGKNIKLSINISPFQIANDNFILDIKRIIECNNFNCKNLDFEITENYPLCNIDKLDEKVKKLKKMNINLSLDDFGKGYNSIKYLLDFSFNNVKIDKKYIDMLIENPDFIDSMIKMIHSVGSKVVSEGVETKEQVDILKLLDCDIMQGYYFYKPLSFDELLERLKSKEVIISEGR